MSIKGNILASINQGITVLEIMSDNINILNKLSLDKQTMIANSLIIIVKKLNDIAISMESM